MKRSRAAVLALSMLALTSCGASQTEGAAATPPANAVQVRVYTRGGEGDQSVRWHIRSAGSADQGGVVSPDAEGTCIFVGPSWVLDVTAEDGASLKATAGAGQFSGDSPLELAIERDDDGVVSVAEGQPDWWPDARRSAARQTDALPLAS